MDALNVTPEAERRLRNEFLRIKQHHKQAIHLTAVRVVTGPSVMRVFKAGTRDDLLPLLNRIPVRSISSFRDQAEYKRWFDEWSKKVGNKLAERNSAHEKVNPGLRWGHATKILALLVRDLVLSSRLFSEREADRVTPWLYVPIDSIVMGRLKEFGLQVGFERIKDIDTHNKFHGVQDVLGAVASQVGVPRIWFDDNWGDRQAAPVKRP